MRMILAVGKQIPQSYLKFYKPKQHFHSNLYKDLLLIRQLLIANKFKMLLYKLRDPSVVRDPI